MRLSFIFRRVLVILLFVGRPLLAADDYPPHPDSIAQAGVPKGELLKGFYTANERSVFPGTERAYQIYLPAGFDKSKPTPFMVFQDGVIYNAPVVFDNLIAKHDLPALIGIFINPGVVPAVNPDALPRFNRSYEYDSVSATYSSFLIDEFLPAISERHGISLSTDANDAAICGNSSGGICAFMTAWHRPDRFRRVFTGVGTYVGIHGADQLPVLVRKLEPKPLRVYLQSGEQDNNLYCGDWWMANQTMERSLAWAGYDVAHTWGTGGHNGKQATAIFPDVLRWLWRDWSEAKEINANPRGDSKWLGYQVVQAGSGWEEIKISDENTQDLSADMKVEVKKMSAKSLAASATGEVYFFKPQPAFIFRIPVDGQARLLAKRLDVLSIHKLAVGLKGELHVLHSRRPEGARALGILQADDSIQIKHDHLMSKTFVLNQFQRTFLAVESVDSWPGEPLPSMMAIAGVEPARLYFSSAIGDYSSLRALCLSPDQSLLYGIDADGSQVWSIRVDQDGTKEIVDPFADEEEQAKRVLSHAQPFYHLDSFAQTHPDAKGLCVDTDGRLYVATALGIQVCDQAGRVNFIIPIPQQAYDVCFGGKDLAELFITCGDRIFKRPTKVHGLVSGQMAPVKPAAPKL